MSIEAKLHHLKLKIEPYKSAKQLVLPIEAQKLFDVLKKSPFRSAIVRETLAISPSGRFIASALQIPKVVIWDLYNNTVQMLSPTDMFSKLVKYKGINHILFSPDEKKVAVAYGGGGWIVWNIKTKQKVHILKDPIAASFSYDSSAIFYNRNEGRATVQKYDFFTKKTHIVHNSKQQIEYIKPSFSGKYMALVYVDKICIYLLQNNKFIKKASLKVRKVSALQWSHCDNVIVAGAELGQVFMWKLIHGKWQAVDIAIKNLKKKVLKISFSPNGKNFALFSKSNIIIYNILSKQRAEAAIGYFKGASAFSPQWKYMVLPSLGGGFLLYNLDKNKDLVHLPPQQFAKNIDKIMGHK